MKTTPRKTFKSLFSSVAGKAGSYYSRDLSLTLSSITGHGMDCSGVNRARGVFQYAYQHLGSSQKPGAREGGRGKVRILRKHNLCLEESLQFRGKEGHYTH